MNVFLRRLSTVVSVVEPLNAALRALTGLNLVLVDDPDVLVDVESIEAIEPVDVESLEAIENGMAGR
jgi:hypothetical protein